MKLILSLASLLVLTTTLFAQTEPAAEAVTPQTVSLDELDSKILKERLKKIYGEMNQKGMGEWKVVYQAKNQVWRLTDKGWKCPPDAFLKCEDWLPSAFRWWVLNKGWLEAWNPEKKLGFDFGKPRADSMTAAPTPETGAAPADDTVEASQAEFSSKRMASEVWDFKSGGGKTARLFISLRDSKIEGLDYEGVREQIEWAQKAGRPFPELAKVSVIKNGERVIFTPNK